MVPSFRVPEKNFGEDSQGGSTFLLSIGTDKSVSFPYLGSYDDAWFGFIYLGCASFINPRVLVPQYIRIRVRLAYKDPSELQIGHINASVTVSPNVTFRASLTAAHWLHSFPICAYNHLQLDYTPQHTHG